MKIFRSFAVAVLVGIAAVLAAGKMALATSIVLDFEDLGPSFLDPIPDGYQGFEWRDIGELPSQQMAFYAPDLMGRCSTTGGTFAGGYCNGTVSGEYVAFRGNSGGTPATMRRSTAFNIESGYFTSPWRNGAHLQIHGYLGGILLYSDDFIFGTLAPELIELNYLGIDKITFFGGGGVNAGHDGDGSGFVIDNLTYSEISAIPLPPSITLFATALLGLAAIRRRRRGGLAV
mgnify:CR=1 FL=1|jgi:hypothetical protein